MKEKKPKRVKEYQVICNYGYGDGWEVVTAETSLTEAKARLKEYRENEQGYGHKLRVKYIKQ